VEILRRFLRLVEERFREHLPVCAYARLLGITPDRLHAVCTRALKQAPRDLIQRRLVQEGIVRLESSGATVKQIAFALGFKDAAYFNRFFRRHVGQPPGTWRRATAIRGALARSSRAGFSFADWP
jgi:AraC family transcriptional regulator, transcriptional activator of pobA